LSVDPLTQSYPWYTPYQFAGNKPIWAIDLDGLEEWIATLGTGPDGKGAWFARLKPGTSKEVSFSVTTAIGNRPFNPNSVIVRDLDLISEGMIMDGPDDIPLIDYSFEGAGLIGGRPGDNRDLIPLADESLPFPAFRGDLQTRSATTIIAPMNIRPIPIPLRDEAFPKELIPPPPPPPPAPKTEKFIDDVLLFLNSGRRDVFTPGPSGRSSLDVVAKTDPNLAITIRGDDAFVTRAKKELKSKGVSPDRITNLPSRRSISGNGVAVGKIGTRVINDDN